MIAMVIKSMPFGTQMIKSVLIQLGSDLEEASKVCGGTWLHTFRRVIFPLAMPALITVGLVGFISAARDISTVVLLGSGKSRTLSLLMLDFAAGAEFEKATVVAVIIVGLGRRRRVERTGFGRTGRCARVGCAPCQVNSAPTVLIRR